jgi:hypothetical protein
MIIFSLRSVPLFIRRRYSYRQEHTTDRVVSRSRERMFVGMVCRESRIAVGIFMVLVGSFNEDEGEEGTRGNGDEKKKSQ